MKYYSQKKEQKYTLTKRKKGKSLVKCARVGHRVIFEILLPEKGATMVNVQELDIK